jgi:hypothetical protein
MTRIRTTGKIIAKRTEPTPTAAAAATTTTPTEQPISAPDIATVALRTTARIAITETTRQ